MAFDNLTILIPTRNREAILARTVRGLRGRGLDGVPLLVYDDASDDPASVRRAVSHRPGGQVVQGTRRIGQAAGRNALLRRCRTAYALLLDDDMRFLRSDGLARHTVEPRDASSPAVVTFRSVSVAESGSPTPAPGPARESCSFCAGLSLCHVPSLLDVGGFRDFFVYGWEEPELAMRLWLRGFRLWYDPAVVLEHDHRETTDEGRCPREYDYLYARNILLSHTLNAPLPLGLCLGSARVLRFLCGGRRRGAAVARGFAHGLRMTVTRRAERRPASMRRFAAWLRYERACRRQDRTAWAEEGQ
jgi:GT2 family glycosyltransferase